MLCDNPEAGDRHTYLEVRSFYITDKLHLKNVIKAFTFSGELVSLRL